MPNQKPAWKGDLLDFKSAILSLQKVDSELFHETVVTDTEIACRAEELARLLCGSGGGRSLVDQISVIRPDNVVEEHFFFAETPHSYRAFRDAFTHFDRLLAKIPLSALPRPRPIFSLPRPARNMVQWMRLLYHLSAIYPSHTLPVELWASLPRQLSDEPPDFHLFDDFDRLPEFDPWSYLTQIGPHTLNLGEWRKRHEVSGVAMPEIFNAHFQKNVFYATANGIDAIIVNASREIVASPSSPKRRARKTPAEDRWRLLTIAALFQHHGIDGGMGNTEPLTQEGLAEILGTSPATASRAMKAVFNKNRGFRKEGFREYLALCSREAIAGILTRVEDKSLAADSEWHDKGPDDE